MTTVLLDKDGKYVRGLYTALQVGGVFDVINKQIDDAKIDDANNLISDNPHYKPR